MAWFDLYNCAATRLPFSVGETVEEGDTVRIFPLMIVKVWEREYTFLLGFPNVFEKYVNKYLQKYFVLFF